jgi:two-component system OmpR family response regulator
MRLLLVEDDVMIAQALQSLLVKEQYVVDWAADGVLAEAMASAASYDLVLLDLGLPGKDGLQVLRTLRARGNRVPVLVATARDTVRDRIAGLDAGADDYVLKPFDFQELLARIRALIRRAAGRAEGRYHYRDIILDPARHEASLAGEPVSLSAREWAVLEPLILRPGLVLSRQQLEDKLYGWHDEISSNAIEVYVHGIRRKLGAELIQNVRGLGYLVPKV